MNFDTGVIAAIKTDTLTGTSGVGGLADFVGTDAVFGFEIVLLSGTPTAFLVSGGNIYKATNLGTSPATWTKIAATLSTTLPTEIVGIGDAVLFSDGTRVLIYDGTNLDTIIDLGGSPVYPPKAPKTGYGDAPYFSISRAGNKYFVPMMDTSGVTSTWSTASWPNIWQWNASDTWTTHTIPTRTVIVTAEKTFTIDGTVGATFVKGGTILFYDGTNTYRAHVCSISAGATSTIRTEETIGSARTPSTGYVKVKTSGGVGVAGGQLANSGNFCLRTMPQFDTGTNYFSSLGTPTYASTSSFTTTNDPSGVLRIGDYIRVTTTGNNHFDAHISAFSGAGPYTVTLHEAVAINQTYVAVYRVSPDRTKYPTMELAINASATPGLYLELYLGADSNTSTGYDMTCDWAAALQLLIRSLYDNSPLIGEFVQVSIGEASGTEIVINPWSPIVTGWHYGDMSSDSTGALLASSARNTIKYIRFTVLKAPTVADLGSNAYLSHPIMGFRASGVVPALAQYAARTTDHTTAGSIVISRSPYTVYDKPINDFADLIQNPGWGWIAEIMGLKIPAFEDLYYLPWITMKPDTGHGMQVFRRDAALGDFRLVFDKADSYSTTPLGEQDTMDSPTLLTKETIGSATEMCIPPSRVLFGHQGRVFGGYVQIRDVEASSTTTEKLGVYASSAKYPLRFDKFQHLGADFDVTEPVYFTISSALGGDEVVAGRSVPGVGSGRALIGTRGGVFEMTGQHAGDYRTRQILAAGALGRWSIVSAMGDAYIAATDKQIWQIGAVGPRITSEAVHSRLLVADFAQDPNPIRLGAGDNKLFVGINTNYLVPGAGRLLYADLAPVMQSGIAWAEAAATNEKWELFARYDVFDSTNAPLWGVKKNSNGTTTTIHRIQSSTSSTVDVAVRSREFSLTPGEYMQGVCILVKCDTEGSAGSTDKQVTINWYFDRKATPTGTQVQHINPFSSGDASSTLAYLYVLLPQSAQGRTVSVELVRTGAAPGWKVWLVDILVLVQDGFERWGQNSRWIS